jgi:HK97 family phage prohead protease
MKINQKDSKLVLAKSIDAEKKTITAYVSTFEWDRTDEKFAKGAWNLANFKANPVVMWAHDYRRPPIGKAIRIEEDQNGLFSEMQYAPDDFSMQIFELFKGGFLSAFSVGFNPKDFVLEPIDADRKGIVYTNVELLEYSAVPIPANPGAIITHDMAEIVTKTLGAQILTKVNGKDDAWIVNPLGPEEPEKPEPEPTEKPDLESSLKYVIDLAKTARASKLEKNQLGLLTNAVGIFQEILNDNQEGVPAEAVKKLGAVVHEYAKVIENLFPDASLTVRRAMNQIDKALREHGRAV